MDETYIKIKGKDSYLYRAVDSEGKTIDFFDSENRDKKAAKEFFKKALKATHNQQPRVITTDKYAATEVAINEMIYDGTISSRTTLRKVKYFNNIIEQDHRFIKRKIKPMLGFYSYETAEKTIAGIEMMNMIRKGQVNWTEREKQNIKGIKWVDIEAAEQILANMPLDSTGQIIQRRDLHALMEVKKNIEILISQR